MLSSLLATMTERSAAALSLSKISNGITIMVSSVPAIWVGVTTMLGASLTPIALSVQVTRVLALPSLIE